MSTHPNVEERLSAAAFTILTDGQRHEHRAERWALRFLRAAARGGETEFQRHIGSARVRAFRGVA